jgi:ABC-type transport system substrate-binding protein
MIAFRRIFIILTVVVALAALAVPAFAQGTTTRTVTEDQINASYRVTNPVYRSVTNAHVDLQAGQAVISATFTYRRTGSFEGEAVLVPTIRNGRVYWSVVSATQDGVPVSDELLNQINASIATSWRNYVREQLPAGRVTAVDISEDAITFTLTARASA